MAVVHKIFATFALAVGVVALVPVLVLAAPFLAVAGATRLLGLSGRRQPTTVQWKQLVQFEPEIGWKPRPNMDTYGKADEVFRVRTGPDGWRGTVSMSDADIVVFGDSFAFGHGAEEDGMYTRFCNGLRVKPIGSDGYNMVHGLLWMRRLAPELMGKMVAWFVYCGNDLHENLVPSMQQYRMPFLRESTETGDWETVTSHVSPTPWPFWTPRDDSRALAEFCCSPTAQSHRAFSAADHLISEAAMVCSAAGARLVVVSIPMREQISRRGHAKLAALAPDRESFDVDRPDKRLQEACHRAGVPFLPLKAHLGPRHYLPADIHWTRQGHRRVGQLLGDQHGRLRALDGSRPADTARADGQENP